MVLICFVGVAPDTLENIRPGFYKIGNVESSSYFGVYKLAVFFGAGVLLNRVRICIEEGHN